MRAINDFMKKLETEFDVGKIRIEPKITFAGCTIEQDEEGNVLLFMNDYIKRLVPATLSKARRRERSDAATAEEIHEYRSLAGTLMYLGSAVLSQASFVTLRMQQEIGRLQVSHIIEANAMVAEVLQLKPEIRFIRPLKVSGVSLLSLSDASHGSWSNNYGQTGILSELKIETSFNEDPVFHPLYWVSNKQRRVTYSSFGAEIFACADAEDRGIDMKYSLQNIYRSIQVPHTIFVDSKALFDTITILHEPREYRLRKTVTLLRDAFEAGELDCLTWIPGLNNISDALTKRSVNHSRTMNKILTSGYWQVNTNGGISHHSDTWK